MFINFQQHCRLNHVSKSVHKKRSAHRCAFKLEFPLRVYAEEKCRFFPNSLCLEKAVNFLCRNWTNYYSWRPYAKSRNALEQLPG